MIPKKTLGTLVALAMLASSGVVMAQDKKPAEKPPVGKALADCITACKAKAEKNCKKTCRKTLGCDTDPTKC
jgi:hypothetical protein